MCDEAAADSIAALKLIPDWFVKSRMIKNYFMYAYAYGNVLCAYGNVFYFN